MKQLNNKEIKQLNEYISKYKITINQKQRVTANNELIFIDNNPLFIKIGEQYLPTLNASPLDLPSVYIDKGAIPFVIKGADLMRPGIVSFDKFNKDDVVVMKDAEHKKTLALGVALFDSEELKKQEKGKSIKTYTYIGDKYWELTKK